MPHDRHSLPHFSTGNRQAQRSQWERVSPKFPTFRKLYFLKEATSSLRKIPGITHCISLRSFLASPLWRPRFQHSVWAVPHHWIVSLIPAGQWSKALVRVPMAQLCPPQAAFPYQGSEGHTEFSVHNLNLYMMFVQTFPEPKQGATDQRTPGAYKCWKFRPLETLLDFLSRWQRWGTL